ncbi:MAG: rhodanese-related sulfurtransferase [Anaerolineaceae bacterium]|nr:rhodanese-related sulfurtransferase [Anaerolineaceae bacterium]
MIYHIDANELHQLLTSEDSVVLLDIREALELRIASFPDERVVHLPLSKIAEQGIDGIPQSYLSGEQKLIIFCHIGQRSQQFCYWLEQFTSKPLYNLLGGINGYTAVYAPEIPQY